MCLNFWLNTNVSTIHTNKVHYAHVSDRENLKKLEKYPFYYCLNRLIINENKITFLQEGEITVNFSVFAFPYSWTLHWQVNLKFILINKINVILMFTIDENLKRSSAYHFHEFSHNFSKLEILNNKWFCLLKIINWYLLGYLMCNA